MIRVSKLIDLVKRTKRKNLNSKGKSVLIIGNGGSYANAVHLCNDFLAVGIRCFTLDPATLTASANDFGYETVFERWISVVGQRGDLLISLSGSGQSKNIIKAIKMAKRRGMTTVSLIGSFGKEPIASKKISHYWLSVGENMQKAEVWQIAIGHEVYLALKK